MTITTFPLSPSVECHDEQVDWIVEQFEAMNETLDHQLDQYGTEEQIENHVPLNELCEDYHKDNWFSGHANVFMYPLSMICLVIEKKADGYTINKAWYTGNWEDLENFA